MTQDEATKHRIPRPVVVSKCATPNCNNQTALLYCRPCRVAQRLANPEAR